jgi:hypothetical protein
MVEGAGVELRLVARLRVAGSRRLLLLLPPPPVRLEAAERVRGGGGGAVGGSGASSAPTGALGMWSQSAQAMADSSMI